ncbi:hypothetical protein THAOC_32890, partial [Thalassiosira oceanica]
EQNRREGADSKPKHGADRASVGTPGDVLANVSRELLALAVRNGGLGIRNPIGGVTLTLVDSIVRGGKLDMLAHELQMKETRKKAERYVRAMDEASPSSLSARAKEALSEK